jgi:hypothetical protein
VARPPRCCQFLPHGRRRGGVVTGLPISGVLKEGLHALEEKLARNREDVPFDIFRQLDLGPGGYAIAPSTRTRAGVRQAIERKHRRAR